MPKKTARTGGRLKLLIAGAGVIAIVGAVVLVASIPDAAERSDPGVATAQGRTAVEPPPAVPAPKSTLPFSQLNRCEAPLAAPGPSGSGLSLTVDFPAWASTHDGPIIGTATLTNTSDEIRRGGFEGPNVALSRDSVVQWHTPWYTYAAASLPFIDLGPGESTEFTVSFEPAVCSTALDAISGERWTDLPPLPSGKYEVSAYFKFRGAFGDVDGQSPRDGAGSTISKLHTIVLD
jgi:hypothetical protein